MRGLILSFTLCALLSSGSIHAASYRCEGTNNDGGTIKVSYDDKAKTIDVNGLRLKIEAGVHDENGVATENFTSDDKIERYYSLVLTNKNGGVLKLFNANDDEEVAVVTLSCH